LVNTLASQPVTAFTAALTLLDSYGRVRVWFNQQKDSLAQLNSRNALRTLRPFRGNAARIVQDTPSDVEIRVGEMTYSRRPPRGMIRLPDGTYVLGRQITHVRNNEDGTQDIIHVEG
jgi:hypothetical protein